MMDEINEINDLIGINNIDQKKKEKNAKSKNTEHMHMHIGHRQRMRERYIKNGADSFEFHEMLEIILYYAIPRSNTNNIAHDLEQKFGKSLSNILEANENVLTEINGISKNTALFFKIIADITRIYNIDRAVKHISSSTIDKTVFENYLIAYYTGILTETVVLLALNNRVDNLSAHVIYTGSVNSSKVDLHKMVKVAIDNNASSVIVAHNHPDGSACPSPEDIETTRRIKRVFNEININFIDHYVVSGAKISSINDKLVHDYLK